MTLVRSLWLQRVADGAVDLIFPASCLACKAELQAELSDESDRIGLCTNCRYKMSHGDWKMSHGDWKMARRDWPVCRRCASRVPTIPGEVSECARCRDQNLWFDRALALGSYDGLLRDLTVRMKTDRSERLAGALGQLMVARFGDDLREMQLDAIVAVPMHAWRRLARGTNPPAALAASLGRELRLPAFSRLLIRRRNTQPQLGLSQPARFRNVRNEMLVRASYHLGAPHVLLIDDILTTGATCSEAARMLKRAGAARVSVLVAARTPRD